jgi:hypothetical protein
MKVWLVCFVGLFGLAELCQWIRAFPLLGDANLPVTVLLGAGLALAIASNSTKQAGLPWQNPPKNLNSTKAQSCSEPLPPLPTVPLNQTQTSDTSISFTIHKHSFPQEPSQQNPIVNKSEM